MSLPCSGNLHILERGDFHEDSCNSGLSLHAHRRHGTDNGFRVWFYSTGLLTKCSVVLPELLVLHSLIPSARRFPPPWSVEGSIKERVRLAPGCRYEFQILSAASPTAVFKDIVFDELARTECRQT
jgi:hypothetical protein